MKKITLFFLISLICTNLYVTSSQEEKTSIMQQTEQPAPLQLKELPNNYLPILTYQSNLYKMLIAYISRLFLTEKPSDLTDKKPKKKKKISVNPIKRQEAIDQIKEIMTKIFDPEDAEHISEHLDMMVALSKNLDPVLDAKAITAINFLFANQHRCSLLDTLFWTKMIKEKELDTAIPMSTEIAKKPGTVKLSILRKKMATKKTDITNINENNTDDTKIVTPA